MSYFSDNGPVCLPHMLQKNLLPRLITLVEVPLIEIQVACLRTIGNILTGDDAQTQMTIEAGALNCMARLLSHERKAVRKEVCWCLSNITAGSAMQI